MAVTDTFPVAVRLQVQFQPILALNRTGTQMFFNALTYTMDTNQMVMLSQKSVTDSGFCYMYKLRSHWRLSDSS